MGPDETNTAAITVPVLCTTTAFKEMYGDSTPNIVDVIKKLIQKTDQANMQLKTTPCFAVSVQIRYNSTAFDDTVSFLDLFCYQREIVVR